MDTPQETIDSTSLDAWLMPLSNDIRVVLAPGEVKYLERPEKLVRVPGLPAYSSQAFLWHERFVPLIHLPQLLGQRPVTSDAPDLVVIVQYQSPEQEKLALGALPLAGMPDYIRVTPDQARSRDSLPDQWPHLSAAALSHEQTLYPVLDLARLFGSTPQELIGHH